MLLLILDGIWSLSPTPTRSSDLAEVKRAIYQQSSQFVAYCPDIGNCLRLGL